MIMTPSCERISSKPVNRFTLVSLCWGDRSMKHKQDKRQRRGWDEWRWRFMKQLSLLILLQTTVVENGFVIAIWRNKDRWIKKISEWDQRWVSTDWVCTIPNYNAKCWKGKYLYRAVLRVCGVYVYSCDMPGKVSGIYVWVCMCACVCMYVCVYVCVHTWCKVWSTMHVCVRWERWESGRERLPGVCLLHDTYHHLPDVKLIDNA